VKFSFSVLGAAIVVLMMLLHRTTVAVVVLIIVEAVIWIGLAASLLRDRRAGRH
jgi:hypothetical protein